MKHELIQTENYLLIVDDSEIKETSISFYPPFGIGKNINIYGELCFHIEAKEGRGSFTQRTYQTLDVNKKTIAHLPLNGAPVLEGVDLLPPLEDEVERLAESMLPPKGTFHRKWVKIGIIAGYNKAKEKYKYTDEDLRKAIRMCKGEFTKGIVYTQEQIIQSLQQTKMPVGFECEWNTEQMPEFHQAEPKTTKNSQGQTVWVGKYIFND